MTTPVGKDTMPYGVTVEGDGNSKDARILAPHPRRDSASYLQLEPGPVRVAVSWEGPEEMRAYVYNRGTRQGRVVATIPARSGGGVRSAIVPVGAVEGDMVKLYCISAPPTVGARGTIEVYPLPQL